MAASTVGWMSRSASDRTETGEIGDADLVLIRRVARGDRDALAALYQRHGGSALALARRMLGDGEAAEEVVQDVFVAVWRRAATFRPEASGPRTGSSRSFATEASMSYAAGPVRRNARSTTPSRRRSTTIPGLRFGSGIAAMLCVPLWRRYRPNNAKRSNSVFMAGSRIRRSPSA